MYNCVSMLSYFQSPFLNANKTQPKSSSSHVTFRCPLIKMSGCSCCWSCAPYCCCFCLASRCWGSSFFFSSFSFHPSGIKSHLTIHHKLIRSKLSRSPLFTLLTTPNLKNFSSPPAVLPPIYILSAPNTSRNPSLELSLPRRRDCCGMGIARGGCSLAAAAAAAACAAVPEGAWLGREAGDVEGVETE